MTAPAQRAITIPTVDGERLGALLDLRPGASGAIVVCHPHPEHGGTMRHPLLEAITAAATSAGFDVLRFDFRGVGDSTGIHGDGVAELNDVAAAVAAMEDVGTPVIGITGWSFGAATALTWHTAAASTIAYVGIAPPVDSPLSPHLPMPSLVTEPADRSFIIGARDQFVDIDALTEYAVAIGASVVRYETADHFFIGRYDRVASDVIAAIAP